MAENFEKFRWTLSRKSIGVRFGLPLTVCESINRFMILFYDFSLVKFMTHANDFHSNDFVTFPSSQNCSKLKADTFFTFSNPLTAFTKKPKSSHFPPLTQNSMASSIYEHFKWKLTETRKSFLPFVELNTTEKKVFPLEYFYFLLFPLWKLFEFCFKRYFQFPIYVLNSTQMGRKID